MRVKFENVKQKIVKKMNIMNEMTLMEATLRSLYKYNFYKNNQLLNSLYRCEMFKVLNFTFKIVTRLLPRKIVREILRNESLIEKILS